MENPPTKLTDDEIEILKDIINEDDPLSDDDIKILKNIIDDYKNAAWMRRQMKIWGTWIIGAPVAIWAFLSASQSILDWVFKIFRGH